MAIRRPTHSILSECQKLVEYYFRGTPTTPWELTQAKNTLQQFRGRSLDELPHQDLLKVTKAFQVIARYREGGVNDSTF